jgi:hypothetical protein
MLIPRGKGDDKIEKEGERLREKEGERELRERETEREGGRERT